MFLIGGIAMGNPFVYAPRAAHPEGFDPFNPDLAGTLREVAVWLAEAPRPGVMRDTVTIDASAMQDMRLLVRRALARVGQ
jgi:hypothetical protein